MSLGLYPIIEPAVDLGGFLGETLALEYDSLHSLAERAGLKPLIEFYGWPDFEVPADFDGDPDDLRELLGPPTWHDPKDVRRAIGAIRALIAEGEGTFARAERSHVEAELVALESILESATRAGSRVYLDMF